MTPKIESGLGALISLGQPPMSTFCGTRAVALTIFSVRANALKPRMANQEPTHDAESDEALMEAYRRGDGEAFQRLVLRHSRGLYNYLLRSVRSQARAEELLQDVLVRVIRSRHRYERSARFTTWVYTIARNLCVDESRRARFRDHDSLDRPLYKRGRRPQTRLGVMAADQLPTDIAAEAPRLRERLAAALECLPAEQREVFVMRQLSGLSFREIGVAVGAPENTVKSRMRYALEKLRQELADLRPPGEEDRVTRGGEKGMAHG